MNGLRKTKNSGVCGHSRGKEAHLPEPKTIIIPENWAKAFTLTQFFYEGKRGIALGLMWLIKG
ncbi:hypothetical protein WQ57_09240 [Mesobacillus campisalis]|uniref:Uncharacterized protein n=1 Tax=Mesobacillus campisalis TaxID=1408103 RepID=A0A0M2SW31_9BACI|nr:hypothetical protein WQ57_09240 [Mesobacillus campisalis]